MKRPRVATRGLVFALGSALAFALMGWCVHLAGRRMPPAEVACGRGLIGVVTLLPFVGRRAFVLLTPASASLWVRSLAGAAAVFSFFWTVHASSVAASRALTDLAPAFVVVIAWLTRSEPPSLKLTCVILAMSCAAILLNLDDASGVSGLVLGVGLFGAACASIAYHALRRAAQLFSSQLVVFALALTMFVVAPLVPSDHWVVPDLNAGVLLLVIGALGVVGQIWMTRGYADLTASVASALGTTALLWSVVIDVFAEGRRLTTYSALAYSVIAVGAASIHLIDRRDRKAYSAAKVSSGGASP